MYKYLILLTILICSSHTTVNRSEAAGVEFPKFDLKKLKFHASEGKTTKLAKEITLKVNKDLFEKGVVIKANTYGKYFANLDVSNRLDLRYRSLKQDKFSSFQKSKSVVNGGLRVGGFVAIRSRLFLRVGFASQNVNKGNALKTPHCTPSTQGYWKTALDSGLGFEHTFENNLSLSGELRTNLSSIDIKTAHHVAKKIESRQGTFLLALKYLLGSK